MAASFLKAVNMSLTASGLIVAVILLRFVMKKAPKWISVVMWGLVAVRLICPIVMESSFSLVPSSEPIPMQILNSQPTQISSGITAIDNALNPLVHSSLSSSVGNSVNLMQIITAICANVWLLGMAALLMYAAASYVTVRMRVKESVLYRDNVFFSDRIDSPFILGIFRPKIFIPISAEHWDIEYILAHENAHLRRHDQWWKPIGFVILTIYWFNPLAWVAYILLCRDIELACDEYVIRELGDENKKDYSSALINASVQRRIVTACPLSFGEIGVKARVKNILNYKKPAFWVIIAAIAAVILTAVCLMTNPPQALNGYDMNDKLSIFLDSQIAAHYGTESGTHLNDNQVIFTGIDKEILELTEDDGIITAYMWVYIADYPLFIYNASSKPTESSQGTEYSVSINTPEDKEMISASHVRAAITVRETDDGYELVEYWEPRDGRYCAKDVKDKFPKRLHHDALSPEKYAEVQSLRCYALYMARAHSHGVIDEADYDVDGDRVIEHCSLRYGTTSGLFSFVLQATTSDGAHKYFNTYVLGRHCNLSFATKGGKTVVLAELPDYGNTDPDNNSSVTYEFEMVVRDGEIELLCGDIPINELLNGSYKD